MRAFTYLLVILSTTFLNAEEPDFIIHHAKIVTVDAKFNIAEAMAIQGERIIAVGTNNDILKLAGTRTRQFHLQGKTVLPGLIDSHTHSTDASVFEFDHTVPEMETIAEVMLYIKSRVDLLEDGEWIYLSQIFITRLRDQRFPTRKELDMVAPKNPVVYRTGPDGTVNSLALQLSGIDKNYQLPKGSKGRIERDPKTGEPTGVLRGCLSIIKSKSSNKKKPTMKQRLKHVEKLLADYNSVGITSFSDRSTNSRDIQLYTQLKENGKLTCRVFLYMGLSPNDDLKKIEQKIVAFSKHPLHQYDNMIWLKGVKLFLDGGMLTGSAYMRQPWGKSKIYGIIDPDYRGMLKIEPDRLYDICKLTMQNELQITAHSVGDGAVLALVNAYERINNKDFPIRKHRPCVTHCNFMSKEAIDKMQKYGIVADLQPAWLWLDGKTLRRQFGNDRLRYFQPYNTLFKQQVVVGGGSDHMLKIGSFRATNPYNPFLGMWITLTRQPRWEVNPIHINQRITREQAIRLYTINNAFLSFEEKEKGSLEKGKLADFIILKQDILTCPIEDVKEIKVLKTYLGGKLIYEKK